MDGRKPRGVTTIKRAQQKSDDNSNKKNLSTEIECGKQQKKILITKYK